MLQLLIYLKKEINLLSNDKKMISKDNLRSFNSIFVKNSLKYGFYLPVTALNQFEIKLPKKIGLFRITMGFFW